MGIPVVELAGVFVLPHCSAWAVQPLVTQGMSFLLCPLRLECVVLVSNTFMVDCHHLC